HGLQVGDRIEYGGKFRREPGTGISATVQSMGPRGTWILPEGSDEPRMLGGPAARFWARKLPAEASAVEDRIALDPEQVAEDLAAVTPTEEAPSAVEVPADVARKVRSDYELMQMLTRAHYDGSAVVASSDKRSARAAEYADGAGLVTLDRTQDGVWVARLTALGEEAIRWNVDRIEADAKNAENVVPGDVVEPPGYNGDRVQVLDVVDDGDVVHVRGRFLTGSRFGTPVTLDWHLNGRRGGWPTIRVSKDPGNADLIAKLDGAAPEYREALAAVEKIDARGRVRPYFHDAVRSIRDAIDDGLDPADVLPGIAADLRRMADEAEQRKADPVGVAGVREMADTLDWIAPAREVPSADSAPEAPAVPEATAPDPVRQSAGKYAGWFSSGNDAKIAAAVTSFNGWNADDRSKLRRELQMLGVDAPAGYEWGDEARIVPAAVEPEPRPEPAAAPDVTPQVDVTPDATPEPDGGEDSPAPNEGRDTRDEPGRSREGEDTSGRGGLHRPNHHNVPGNLNGGNGGNLLHGLPGGGLPGGKKPKAGRTPAPAKTPVPHGGGSPKAKPLAHPPHVQSPGEPGFPAAQPANPGEGVAGHTVEQLDAMTWDQLRDLVGQVPDRHLDALFEYMDSRDTAEQQARSTEPPAAGQPAVNLPAVNLPDGTSAGAGAGTVGAALAAGGYTAGSGGWRKKTRTELGSEVQGLNGSVLDALLARHPHPGRVDDVHAVSAMLPPAASRRLLRGEAIPLRHFLHWGAEQPAQRRAVNPALREEDTLHLFGLTLPEMAAAARHGKTWRIPGSITMADYVAAYEASRDPRHVDPGMLGDYSPSGDTRVEPGRADAGGAPAGATHSDSGAASPAAPIADVAPGQPDGQQVTPAAPLWDAGARADAFGRAVDGWADLAATHVRPGDLIRGGSGGDAMREVLDVTRGERDGLPGVQVDTRDGARTVSEFYADGSPKQVTVNTAVGRALDRGIVDASVPTSPALTRTGRFVPAGNPQDITPLGAEGRFSPEQVADVIRHAAGGATFTVTTVDGRTLSGHLARAFDGHDVAVVNGKTRVTLDPADVTGIRVLSGIVDVRGPAGSADMIPAGGRVAARVGRIDRVGELVRDAAGLHILDDGGRRHDLPEGTPVAPVFEHAGAADRQVGGQAPGVWSTSPTGAVVAGSPGEWSAAVIPLGDQGAHWRLDGPTGAATGRAGSVTEAKAEVGRRIADAAKAGHVTFLARDEPGRAGVDAPKEAPAPIGGRGAEWAPATSITIGDQARVTG
ncbi:MAG TPA: hypothetical protein VFP72_23635, partial [Kineosporiaceae bacterium]|nr:hypothetical protein [Kineosporiaceae bacterium]